MGPNVLAASAFFGNLKLSKMGQLLVHLPPGIGEGLGVKWALSSKFDLLRPHATAFTVGAPVQRWGSCGQFDHGLANHVLFNLIKLSESAWCWSAWDGEWIPFKLPSQSWLSTSGKLVLGQGILLLLNLMTVVMGPVRYPRCLSGRVFRN